MADELNILLSAMLDEQKSISNINGQVKSIQDKLKNINISLNIDDFKTSLNSVFGDFEKNIKKVSDQKLEFKSLDGTIGQIQGLSKNLDVIFEDLKKIGNVKGLKNIYADDGSIKGFNVQLESVKGNLKEVANYNVLGKLNQDTQTWEYALDKINTKLEEVKQKTQNIGKTSTANPMSGLQKALDTTITNYKNGTLQIEDYVKRMQSIMYAKDGSTYKTDFTNIPEKQRLEYVNKLITATNDLDKQSTASANNQAKALNAQVLEVQKLQNLINNANTKYSVGVDATKSAEIQNQITAFSQLIPLTTEYDIALANVRASTQQYASDLKGSVTAEQAQARALTDKTVAVDQLQQKLSGLQNNKLIDSGALQNAQRMVDSLKTMEAGTTQFRNATKLAANEVNKLVNQSKALNTLGSTFKLLSQLFMIGTPIMLARKVMTEMVSTINEFNSAMTDIRVVTGMSYDSVEKLREGYTELGKTIGATTQEIMASAIEFTRQGRSIADTQELINATIVGSKLSGVESGEMTNYLTAAINGYGVAAKDAISVIDKLVAVDNKSASSMAELSLAMSRTSNSAQMVGVDMDTLIGYIATISSVTRKSADTIGESMKTIFTRFNDIKIGDFVEDGTVVSDVRKTLENVGVELMKSETEFRDFGDVITDLSGKWNTLNDAEKASLGKAMAG